MNSKNLYTNLYELEFGARYSAQKNEEAEIAKKRPLTYGGKPRYVNRVKRRTASEDMALLLGDTSMFSEVLHLFRKVFHKKNFEAVAGIVQRLDENYKFLANEVDPGLAEEFRREIGKQILPNIEMFVKHYNDPLSGALVGAGSLLLSGSRVKLGREFMQATIIDPSMDIVSAYFSNDKAGEKGAAVITEYKALVNDIKLKFSLPERQPRGL